MRKIIRRVCCLFVCFFLSLCSSALYADVIPKPTSGGCYMPGLKRDSIIATDITGHSMKAIGDECPLNIPECAGTGGGSGLGGGGPQGGGPQ